MTSEIEGGVGDEVEVDVYEQEQFENNELVETEIQKRLIAIPPKATQKTNTVVKNIYPS